MLPICPLCERQIKPNEIIYAWDIHRKCSVTICSDPDCAAEFNRKMRKISKEKRKSCQHGNADSKEYKITQS